MIWSDNQNAIYFYPEWRLNHNYESWGLFVSDNLIIGMFNYYSYIWLLIDTFMFPKSLENHQPCLPYYKDPILNIHVFLSTFLNCTYVEFLNTMCMDVMANWWYQKMELVQVAFTRLVWRKHTIKYDSYKHRLSFFNLDTFEIRWIKYDLIFIL